MPDPCQTHATHAVLSPRPTSQQPSAESSAGTQRTVRPLHHPSARRGGETGACSGALFLSTTYRSSSPSLRQRRIQPCGPLSFYVEYQWITFNSVLFPPLCSHSEQPGAQEQRSIDMCVWLYKYILQHLVERALTVLHKHASRSGVSAVDGETVRQYFCSHARSTVPYVSHRDL